MAVNTCFPDAGPCVSVCFSCEGCECGSIYHTFESTFTQRDGCAEEHVELSALIWRCNEVKYSPASIIRCLYFNPYGILLLPYFHDHSKHSKNKILLQLDDDSLCFLPMYAKLLWKAESRQITATLSSCIFKVTRRLVLEIIPETRTIFTTTSSLGSCFLSLCLVFSVIFSCIIHCCGDIHIYMMLHYIYHFWWDRRF